MTTETPRNLKRASRIALWLAEFFDMAIAFHLLFMLCVFVTLVVEYFTLREIPAVYALRWSLFGITARLVLLTILRSLVYLYDRYVTWPKYIKYWNNL